MKNVEIIALAQAKNNVMEPVHTYSEWKKQGFIVRKGEHAAFKTKIWVATKELVEVKEGVFENQTKFVLKLTAFFAQSQVEAA